MKNLTLLILTVCFATIATAQPTSEYQKRYQVKSGHVEYKLTGTQVGTKSLWWDDFGEKYRQETNSTMIVKTSRGTEEVKDHSLSIADGTYYYNIDLTTNEGTKMHKDAVPDFSILGSGLNDSEMEQLGEGMMNALGGTVNKKSEKVLGRTCDVGQAMGTTVHIYKGVTLRSHSKIKSVENIEEAISFEENISVPTSKFAPPAKVALEDVSNQVSAYEGFIDELVEEQGLLFPSGISFEKFRDESERVRRKLGYTFAMHDASGGEYSAIWMKDKQNTAWVVANSLRNYANWREDFADDGIEYFTHNGRSMAFLSDTIYDEETGIKNIVNILLVELKDKDAFIRITPTPKKSKQQLLEIFDQFKF